MIIEDINNWKILKSHRKYAIKILKEMYEEDKQRRIKRREDMYFKNITDRYFDHTFLDFHSRCLADRLNKMIYLLGGTSEDFIKEGFLYFKVMKDNNYDKKM